jgi:hypothetical protein
MTGSPLTTYSTQMIVIGLLISLIAIPQVRRSLFAVFDGIRAYFFGPDEIPAVPVKSTAEVSGEDSPKSNSRREIDDFDLSIFDDK